MNILLTLLSVLGFLVLTLGTAVFVAAEFALTTLERSTVEANARTGNRRDRLVRRAHRSLSFQLSGAQLGISATSLATGYLAEPLIARLLRQALAAVALPENWARGTALFLALLIATSVSMVFGELAPQNLAVAHPVATARFVAAPQVLFSAVMTPLIRLTNGAANGILRWMGIEPAEVLRSARSPQELGALVRSSGRRGSLDATTAALVGRSLRFGTRTAEELMTPRSKIEALQADETVADLIERAMATGYSRFPIVNGDLDETIGIVHVKQVFGIPAAERGRTRLARLARPIPLVPSTLDGDAVMTQIQAHGLQAALVADEYGGTAGMVTLEDVIEEIVGDVRDEHDDATPHVVAAPDGWRVSGLLRIDEVAAATGYRAPVGGYETIGGLVLQQLGHIPVEGETVQLRSTDHGMGAGHPWLATVERMDGRRIDVLRLVELPQHRQPETGG